MLINIKKHDKKNIIICIFKNLFEYISNMWFFNVIVIWSNNMFILINKIITSKLNILKLILLPLFIYDANKLQGSCVV
jgi:hypothetical protein